MSAGPSAAEVRMIDVTRIDVLNPRERNDKVFEEIVDNIRTIGLKKPITVAERPGDDGDPRYVLVCGEGRLNAFRILGETHIPALVVDVSDEDAFIMSLAENIARWPSVQAGERKHIFPFQQQADAVGRPRG